MRCTVFFFAPVEYLHASNVDGFLHLIRYALCRIIQSLEHTNTLYARMWISFFIQFTIFSSLSVRNDNSKCKNRRWKWKWSVMATYWICVIRVLQCRHLWCKFLFDFELHDENCNTHATNDSHFQTELIALNKPYNLLLFEWLWS